MSDKLVERAINFSKLSLADKKRYSGESFDEHSLKVAEILKRYNINDQSTLAVAILHHSIENGAATSEDVKKEFGEEIAKMLLTLKDLHLIKLSKSDQKEFVENLRRMFLALARDLRIVVIKLADILDNLRTLKYVPRSKQIEVAEETLEIFAPLAERLGMGEMKGEMQDFAFPYLYPREYKDTKVKLKQVITKLDKRLLKIKSSLKQALDKEGIIFSIESRSKHLYSLYTKLKREDINFDISKIYDLIAFRIVVNNIEDCYRVLGVIHNLWKPLPNRLKDYISSPKPNGYQSLHTTVLSTGDKPFEIQIRTKDMHERAEYGIAAHWHYDESKKGEKVDLRKVEWVKNLRNWQEEILDSKEFVRGVIDDFLGDRILVFTPKGEIKDLPSGATPIDFAYLIHSDLGDRAVGAKVNGKLVSLNKKLLSGDTIEILVSKIKKPSRDWLNFVVTSSAKSKIKRFFKD